MIKKMQRFYWHAQIPAWTCENLCAMLPDGFFLQFFMAGHETSTSATAWVPLWQCLQGSQSPSQANNSKVWATHFGHHCL